MSKINVLTINVPGVNVSEINVPAFNIPGVNMSGINTLDLLDKSAKEVLNSCDKPTEPTLALCTEIPRKKR
jgi:hypothetical protein